MDPNVYYPSTTNTGISTGALIGIGLVYLAIIVVVIAGMWKVFAKAGRPGWAALIPIYSAYVLLKIAGKPGWWLLLYLIPFVNIVFFVLTYVALSRSFGKGGGFTVGLIFLSFVFIPILGFGKARYLGPDGDGPEPGGNGPQGYGPPGGYGQQPPPAGYPPPR